VAGRERYRALQCETCTKEIAVVMAWDDVKLARYLEVNGWRRLLGGDPPRRWRCPTCVAG
jgi:hypothetical protein